jgi:hypothetical protein
MRRPEGELAPLCTEPRHRSHLFLRKKRSLRSLKVPSQRQRHPRDLERMLLILNIRGLEKNPVMLFQ